MDGETDVPDMNEASRNHFGCRRCWAEVDLAQLVANLRSYRSHLQADTPVIAVVKADAYGHGAIPVSGALWAEGIRHFAVATLAEGAELRAALPDARILILGYTPPEDAAELIRYRLVQTLVGREYAESLAAAARETIDCCYAVDTGMRRIGLDAAEPDQTEAAIRALPPPLRLRGLITHLCVADAPDDAAARAFTEQQIFLFEALQRRVSDLDMSFSHCLNSAGGLYCGAHGPVRLGIMLYGLRADASVPLPEGMRPALTWKCRVAMVKSIRMGDSVGYGRTWTADRDRRIATLTVGYADGYSRTLSNRGWVLLHGRRAPVVGRVCMDQMMVDVSDIPETAMGDTAVLLGTDGRETITADDMAALTGTIGYEVVCDISPRVPRVCIQDP